VSRDKLMAELEASAREGREIDWSKTGNVPDFAISTPRRTIGVSRWVLIAALVIVLIVLAFWISTSRAEAAALPQAGSACIDAFDHHAPAASPYFSRLFSGTVWVQKLTGTVIAAVRIPECGQYLIGIWRNGRFTTHFLTSWGYITAQAAGMMRSAWSAVKISTILFIIVPCPGMMMSDPAAFARPCPSGGTS